MLPDMGERKGKKTKTTERIPQRFETESWWSIKGKKNPSAPRAIDQSEENEWNPEIQITHR